jgi:hypothetical protein
MAATLIQHWLHQPPSQDFEQFIQQYHQAIFLERRYQPQKTLA